MSLSVHIQIQDTDLSTAEFGEEASRVETVCFPTERVMNDFLRVAQWVKARNGCYVGTSKGEEKYSVSDIFPECTLSTAGGLVHRLGQLGLMNNLERGKWEISELGYAVYDRLKASKKKVSQKLSRRQTGTHKFSKH